MSAPPGQFVLPLSPTPDETDAAVAAERLRRKVDRERRARVEAERLLEEKVRELFEANLRLKNLNEGLERVVADRTRELAVALDAAEAAREKSEHVSLHDPLTGLPNRRYLGQIAARAPRRQRKEGAPISPVALLHIDLDRFKQINDSLGHAAGDFVLLTVARRLADLLDGQGFVARIGGDEFVVLLRRRGEAGEAEALAERIVETLSAPMTFEETALRIGASVGIAIDEAGTRPFDDLLVEADLALYRAKNDGRGTARRFSPGMRQEVVARRAIADDLVEALETGAITPWFQPRIDVRTGAVACAEALARWHHPVQGLIMPGQFIEVADNIGLLHEIDHAILLRAAEDVAALRARGLVLPRLSVNVTLRRLLDASLLDTVSTLALPPSDLSFELLETIALDDPPVEVLDRLEALRRLGVALELDDFGSGRSSILSLQRVSPRMLKIDGGLMRDAPGDPGKIEVCRAVVAIGRALGIGVVAEGIATDRHVALARELGVDQIQGFAVARPMPVEALAEFLGARA